MEVMAAGCPVVLSDIPPHREVIRDLDGVPIVPVGDRAGFAREIRRLREMPGAEREALGERYRAYARERFALQRMHEGYRAVYAELAGARR
jgi:glycosyltransferase involved in cell wall biosynthesis